MKYVMFRIQLHSTTRYFPVIFGEDQVHLQIAEAISSIKIPSRVGHWVRPEAVSAGFIEIKNSGAVECFGESESLKMKPHPEDARIISSLSYMHGLGFSERVTVPFEKVPLSGNAGSPSPAT